MSASGRRRIGVYTLETPLYQLNENDGRATRHGVRLISNRWDASACWGGRTHAFGVVRRHGQQHDTHAVYFFHPAKGCHYSILSGDMITEACNAGHGTSGSRMPSSLGHYVLSRLEKNNRSTKTQFQAHQGTSIASRLSIPALLTGQPLWTHRKYPAHARAARDTHAQYPKKISTEHSRRRSAQVW